MLDCQTSEVTQRGRFDATVLLNRPLCQDHFLLRLGIEGDFPSTRPGQFIQLGCRPPDSQMALVDSKNQGLLHQAARWSPSLIDGPVASGPLRQAELCAEVPLLRRPFSLSGRGEEPSGVWLEVIHRVIGIGTRWLAGLEPGHRVDLIGPLGNAFELPAGKTMALLVGGGVGLPPMFYLAQDLALAGWDAVAFVGARTADLLAVTLAPERNPDPDGSANHCVVEFGRHGFTTVVTTDDGSLGLKGTIVDGLTQQLEHLDLDKRAKSVIFTCGPHAMMSRVAALAKTYGIACQVCLEQAMACGMGTCQSCVVKIEDSKDPQGHTQENRPWRYRLACSDGPVFESQSVVW